jgi:catechol 2,3-dioxygenase-like lactoylglutathione lyase family enzyme
MDAQLHVVVLPVADVDRAKAFYCAAGFREDLDYASGEDFRVVQLTPPGSSTSIVLGAGITTAMPGSTQGLHLCVVDIEAARAELLERGVDISDVFHDIGGFFYHHSPSFEVPGRDPARRPNRSFARFADPDGNGWILQECVPARVDSTPF